MNLAARLAVDFAVGVVAKLAANLTVAINVPLNVDVAVVLVGDLTVSLSAPVTATPGVKKKQRALGCIFNPQLSITVD